MVNRQRPQHPRRVRRLLRGLLAGAALGGLPVLLALAFFASRFAGLTEATVLEQAQLARQLARGAGFSTNVFMPLDLAQAPRPPARAAGHDFRGAPLYPLLLSAIVGPHRTPDNLLGLLSLGFWLATVALTFAFAWRLFGRRTAGLATVLLVVNVPLLVEAIGGRETMAWTFLVGLWLYVTYETSRLPGAATQRWWPVLSGALFGLCCMVSYLSLSLLVPALILLIMLAPEWPPDFARGRASAPPQQPTGLPEARRWPPSRQAWRACLAFLAACLVVTAPWLIRNLVASGNPVFSLSWWALATNTPSHPGDTVLQWHAPTGPIAYAFGHAGEMARKFALGLSRLRDGLFSTADAYVVAIFLFGLLLGAGQEQAARLRTGLGLLLLAAVPTALGSGSPRVFAALVPLVTVFAAQFFLERLDRLYLRVRLSPGRYIRSTTMRSVVLYLGVGTAGYPLLVAFAISPYQYYDPARPTPLETLKARIPQQATVLTNIPWQVAWYTDRRAALLPRRAAELDEIEQRLGRVDYLLLSPPLHPQLVAGDPTWMELATRTGEPLAGFGAGERIIIAPGLGVVLRPRAGTAPTPGGGER